MIERYQYLEIEKIWNDQNKFDTWKLVEQKYLETLEENNISPSGVSEVIGKIEVLEELEKVKKSLLDTLNYIHPSKEKNLQKKYY